MLNALICGIGGKMGRNIFEILQNDEKMRVVCGVDPHTPEGINVPVYADFKHINEDVDVIIDFSSPAALEGELEYATAKGVPAVIASTGFSQEQLEAIKEASKKTAIFKTANFSLGVNLMVNLVKKAADVLGENFDVEIIERHHNKKVDAPSGTALALADAVNEGMEEKYAYVYDRSTRREKRPKQEIGISAVRGGTIVGDHDVIFAGTDEVITFSHTAYSRAVFAKGALQAALFLAGKPAGLYSMSDVIEGG